jgi:uncharacterized protein YjdB
MLAALAMVIWSCDSPAGAARTDVASIEVAPDPATLTADGAVQLQAIARDRSDEPLEAVPMFWSSEDSLIAAVSPEGLVSGRSPGTVRVAASSGGVSALATVIVLPKPVASISIAPSDTTITVDQAVILRATTRDAAGGTLTGRPVAWSSNAPGVAAVDGDGRVVGVAPGTAEITATAEGKDSRSTVHVSRKQVASVAVDPPAAALLLGQRMQFQATALAADGSELPGLDVQWASSNQNIARVSASGLVTAQAIGAATITAMIEEKVATVAVAVGPHPVASLTVTPSAPQLAVGDEQQFEATPKAADGAVLTGRSITWSSSSPAVATVNSRGLVTAVAQGNATITAQSEGKSANASVRVELRTVSTVEVTPATATVTVGTSSALTAVLRGDNGSVLTGRAISWRSGSEAVATVDGNGRVTAVAPGTTSITATSEGVSGSAAITVTPQAVATVEVSPESLTLLVGDSESLDAVLRASDGAVLSGTVTWSSDPDGVATVDANGGVMAVAPGQTRIIATSGGVSGEARVTVEDPPVARVEVNPATLALIVGEAASLEAITTAANGTVLSGRPIDWESSAGSIVTVDDTGRVTAHSPGEATITASSEGHSGEASVTVSAEPVASVEVSPGSLSLIVNEIGTLTATVRNAAGATLEDRTVVWSSDAHDVAAVDDGVVTAVSSGRATITATSEGVSGQASVRVMGVPARISIVSGDNQTGSSNTALEDSLVVQVLDADDRPVEGVRVRWTTSSGQLFPNETFTAPDGTARTEWTLGGGLFLLPRYAYAEVEGLPRVQFTARPW